VARAFLRRRLERDTLGDREFAGGNVSIPNHEQAMLQVLRVLAALECAKLSS
jgi:hypothetical protein